MYIQKFVRCAETNKKTYKNQTNTFVKMLTIERFVLRSTVTSMMIEAVKGLVIKRCLSYFNLTDKIW